MTLGDSQLVRIWRWPAAIVVLTLFGLFSALLGQQGVWLAMSWAALLVPVGVAVYFTLLRSRSDADR